MAEHTCKGIKIENFIFECLFHSNHINGTGGTKNRNNYKCTRIKVPGVI